MQFASLVPLTYGPINNLQHGYYATNYFNRENFCISPTQCNYVLSTILPTAITSLNTITNSYL